MKSEALERVREEWAEMASKLDKELREKDKEKCVAEPLTDLTDAEWKYIRYIGAQIMARNPKPLGFEEWKNQKEET